MASAKFGNLFDTIIQAATVVLPFVTNGQNAHGQPISITQTITQLVTQLNQLEVGFAALSPALKIQNANVALQTAQQIIDALNQLNAPANSGDAGYLANQRQVAARVFSHIQEMIQEAQSGNVPTNQQTPVTPTTQPTATNNTPVTLPSGQIVYVPMQTQQQTTTNNQLINGIDNLYLIGGIGLLAFLLLKK